MSFEAVRDASLMAGGKARRTAWIAGEYVKFETVDRPSHTRMLRGTAAENEAAHILDAGDILAEDWEVLA